MSTLKVDDIQSRQSTDDAISLASDSSVSLKHSASAKLTTTSTGVTVTGTCTATAFSGDGSALTGLSSGVSSDSNRNTVGGTDSGSSLTTAGGNTFYGYKAGEAVTSGGDNTLIGDRVAPSLTDGLLNTCIGAEAGSALTSGDYNGSFGSYAGNQITTGNNNLCLGFQAGQGGSPSGSITTGSNNVVLGNNNISNLYCADTTISSSDQRDKTDITSFNLGLAWVEALRPVTYRWDRRTWYGTDEQPYGTPDGSKKRTQLHVGFLAQEALEVEKTNGYGTSNDDSITVHLNEDEMSYGMKYERLVPILVNAIKELSAEVKALKAG